MFIPKPGTHLQGKVLSTRIEVACGLMFFLFGYDAGVLEGVFETPQFLHSIFGASGQPSGQYDIPLIASSYTLAAVFATPLVMIYGMKTSRRRLLLIANILVFVGGIIQAASYSMAQIIVARVICGFGIGFIPATVPPYQTEQSIDASNRGRKTAITCCAPISGIPLACGFDYGMSCINHSVSWRVPIAMQSVPALISGLIFCSCPDTPRWNYATGQETLGDDTLCRLFDKPLSDPVVMSEKQGILAALQLEHNSPKPKLKDFFWDRIPLKVARRLIICFLILSFQQLMAINFLVYYSTIIFKNNGLDDNTSAILGCVMNTVYWTGTFAAIFVIDRIGRRGVMLRTAIVCTVLMAAFVGLLGVPNDKQTPATRWAASALIIIYNWFFGLGWIAACWQYAPEIAPLEYRHIGAALNASGEWFWSFVTVFASPIAVSNPSVGWRIWLWYLVFNALAISFVYFCCPETANKNLEELDTLFADADKKDLLIEERAHRMAEASETVAARLALRPPTREGGFKPSGQSEMIEKADSDSV